MKKVKFSIRNTVLAVLAAGLLMAPGLTKAAGGPDTVTLKIGNSKMVFIITDEEDIKSLESYDMNEIVKQFESLLDSAGEEGGSIVIDQKKDDNATFLEIRTGSGIQISDRKKSKKRTTNHFHIDFGLNNMTEAGTQISSQPYRLDNWASRYFAMSSMNKVRLGKNKGPANFQFGAELAWNNLMFEDDITIRKIDGLTQWVNYMDPNLPENLQITQGIPARKGKIGIATLGIPVLFGLDLGKDDDVQIAAGGYVNYKLASWTKTVYFEDGDREKVKDRSDYNLNDFRYGVMATFSYKGLSVFGKYDLSPLFNKNPSLDGNPTGDFSVYSFGIRL